MYRYLVEGSQNWGDVVPLSSSNQNMSSSILEDARATPG